MQKSTLGILLSTLIAGCNSGYVATDGAVGADPAELSDKANGDSLAIPEVRCAGVPDRTYPSGTPARDAPNHRGVDLVASASTNPQIIRGVTELAGDRFPWANVRIYACRAGQWEIAGYTNSGGNGEFSLRLPDDSRLPIGVRQMYVSLDDDRSGADFVAMVVPDGHPVMFSDVDGTLTSSEGAAIGAFFGIDVKANEGAAAALSAMVQKGYPVVYVTAMAAHFTSDRRAWLADKGFPLGALRLADGLLLPGSATVNYKTKTFQAVAASGLRPAVGIGNRASDATAYHNAGIPGERVFLKLGQYTDEDQPVIDAGGAVGISNYATDLAKFTSLPDAVAQKSQQ